MTLISLADEPTLEHNAGEGLALAARHDWAGAELAFGRAAEAATRDGDDVALAVATTNRGHALAYLGKLDDAAASLAESLAVRERLHARGAVLGVVVARGLVDSAAVAAARDEGADAAQLLECARAMLDGAEGERLGREVERLLVAIGGFTSGPAQMLDAAPLALETRDVSPLVADSADAPLVTCDLLPEPEPADASPLAGLELLDAPDDGLDAHPSESSTPNEVEGVAKPTWWQRVRRGGRG